MSCIVVQTTIRIQVNLCQKLLFLHQLTHNMTTDCSLNYKFNTWKFQAQNMGRTCCVQKLFLTFRTISVHNMFSPCSAKRRASDKDLPVSVSTVKYYLKLKSKSSTFMHERKSTIYILLPVHAPHGWCNIFKYHSIKGKLYPTY